MREIWPKLNLIAVSVLILLVTGLFIRDVRGGPLDPPIHQARRRRRCRRWSRGRPSLRCPSTSPSPDNFNIVAGNVAPEQTPRITDPLGKMNY
jgi:hypothetical protein